MAGSQEVQGVKQAIIDLDEAHTGELVRKAVAAGATTKDIVENGMRAGMTEVGKKYEAGEYYLAEFELSANVMAKGLATLKVMVPWESGTGETVVLATPRGDLHDMGKSLVASLLATSGYKAVDVGIDTPPEKVVEAVRANDARAVGLSLVLASSIDEARAIIDALGEAGLREKVKVIVGGVVASKDVAARIGADAYVQSAFDVVGVLNEMLQATRAS
ncbi:MAG TPA: cobalamin-dependent protein [Candidatus Anoxymicrobiaceae bacterium]